MAGILGLNVGNVGNLVGGVGHALGLPEMGISELLGGSTAPDAYNAPAGTVLGASTQAPATDPMNTGSNTNTGPTAQQQQQAATQAQIDSGLAQLPGQLNAGNQNILNSYNSAFSRLTGQQQADNQNLANNRTTAETGNQTARDNIGASVRGQLQGLQRLLGAHGAGNSSAASILGPYAAALQGNQQRSQVQDAYGANMNNLKNAQNQTDIGYQNSFGDLGTQKQTQEQQLQSQIDQQKASLLGQEANPDTNQINSLLSAITQLGINPTFTPKTPTVAPVNLQSYQYNPATAAQLSGNGVSDAAAQTVGPFASLLNPQKNKTTLAGQTALTGA